MDLATLCPLTVPDSLARTVALAPDVEAIVASDGRATFAELGAQVAEVRRALLAAGSCSRPVLARATALEFVSATSWENRQAPPGVPPTIPKYCSQSIVCRIATAEISTSCCGSANSETPSKVLVGLWSPKYSL
jgi:hypothetical protein